MNQRRQPAAGERPTQPYRLKQRPDGDWVLSRINSDGNKEQLGPYATKAEAEFVLHGERSAS